MEQLQSLLRQYYLSHQNDLTLAPWSKQYSQAIFPKYWEIIYAFLQPIDKSSKILEVGCGLGDVTAILCFLGFKHITSFEKDENICSAAQRRLTEMFNRNDIVRNVHYPDSKQHEADILILVNCAYADMAKTKQEYLDLMREYYVCAGNPHYFLMEVIDSSYTQNDDEFPQHIRLCSNEVRNLFPNCKICSWETYKYPTNRKSKTLYLIER